jgi:hypothetical protein
MEPKEQAKRLFNKFVAKVQGVEGGILNTNLAKQCAKIIVDEMIAELQCINTMYSRKVKNFYSIANYVEYWEDVKHEIEKI